MIVFKFLKKHQTGKNKSLISMAAIAYSARIWAFRKFPPSLLAFPLLQFCRFCVGSHTDESSWGHDPSLIQKIRSYNSFSGLQVLTTFLPPVLRCLLSLTYWVVVLEMTCLMMNNPWSLILYILTCV